MASERLQVILELVTGQYKREAASAATATGRISAAATSTAGSLRGLQGGFDALKGGIAAIGVTRLVGEFRDMALAAIEDAESQEILAGALRTNTGATDAQVEANERWIASMQIATRTADTELRQALTDLTVTGRSLEEAQNDIAIATDIAASKGLELGAVIKALVRAQASGSTQGLARLGIETKNAAGEMLAYDEVLQNAAKTMGGTAARAAGTLAGAMERSRIAMEEAREEAGGNFAPTLIKAGDAWNELVTAVLGGNQSLAGLQSIFNSLITSGVDPFTDAVGSAGFVLAEFATQMTVPIDTQTFETLVKMLGLTNDQVLELRRNFIQNGDAVVRNKDDLEDIIGVLDQYVGNVDPAVLATQRFAREQANAEGATTDLTAALEAQRDVFREMTDPIFALVAAEERLNDAQAAYNGLVAEGTTRGDEFEGAISDLIRAQADYEFAQREANIAGLEGLDLLEDYAAKAGISAAAFDIWAASIRNASGALSRMPPVPVTSGGIGAVTGTTQRFQHGGVVEGVRGTPQLILAHAGETVLPTHKPGWQNITRNGPTIVVNSPTNNLPMDIQYASLLANHQTFGKF